MKKYIKYPIGIVMLSLVLNSCQDLDRPELGDYPKDANQPGGSLKFYTAFDGTTSNTIKNAVDSVRANFPSNNPLVSIDGIKGKAVKGKKYDYVKYSSANDFVQNASSFTISLLA